MAEIWPIILKQLEGITVLSISLRIFLSMVCGGIIGIERGRANQPAGMRTYMLVCMGAAVVMLTGHYMYIVFQSGDPARLGAQVISGIGFLGAGSIIIDGKTRIRGLTTAAGLWAAACIGLSIGIGFYEAGIIATIAVSLIMSQFKKLENHFIFNDTWLNVYVELDSKLRLTELYKAMADFEIYLDDVQTSKKGKTIQKAILTIKNPGHKGREEIFEYLEQLEGIQFIKYV